MLTIIIAAPSIAECQQQLLHTPPEIEAIEWRIDFLKTIDYAAITELCQQCKKPIILTLRRRQEGGQFNGPAQAHRDALILLAQCRPDFIDIESDIAENVLIEASRCCAVIRSHHDFQHTPPNLPSLIHTLQHHCVSIVKVATHANSTLDSLRMLLCLKDFTPGTVAAHCMGEMGLPSRYLGKIMGSAISYTQPTKSSTILQNLPTIADYQLHRYCDLNTTTQIYGLIGDPVSHSQGDVFHNHYFKEHQINAVYVKMKIATNELPTFFEYAQQLNIKGLSVTMPLKESVIPYIKHVKHSIKAVNTLAFKDSSYAINTDGEGAIRALRQATSLENKSILILGAGGSAIGILNALTQHTSNRIYIHNRTQAKAQALATAFSLQIHSEQHILQHQYDIIISTLPIGAQQQHQEKLNALIQTHNAQLIVLDIIYAPRITPLLQAAQTIGAHCLYGEQMFLEQAKLQQQYWQQQTL